MFSHPRSSFSRRQTYRSAFRLVIAISPALHFHLSRPLSTSPSANTARPTNSKLLPSPFDSSTFAGRRNQTHATFDLRTCASSSSLSMRESDTRSGSRRAGDRVGIGYGIFSSPFRMFLLSSFVLASPPLPAIPYSTLIHQESPLFPSLSTSRPLSRFQSPIHRLRSPRRLFLAYDAALLVAGRTQDRFSFFILFFPFHAHCHS